MEKISEEEKNNRIFILTSLIKENEKDHVRLEKELQELLDLDPLKQKNIKFTFCLDMSIKDQAKTYQSGQILDKIFFFFS